MPTKSQVGIPVDDPELSVTVPVSHGIPVEDPELSVTSQSGSVGTKIPTTPEEVEAIRQQVRAERPDLDPTSETYQEWAQGAELKNRWRTGDYWGSRPGVDFFDFVKGPLQVVDTPFRMARTWVGSGDPNKDFLERTWDQAKDTVRSAWDPSAAGDVNDPNSPVESQVATGPSYYGTQLREKWGVDSANNTAVLPEYLQWMAKDAGTKDGNFEWADLLDIGRDVAIESAFDPTMWASFSRSAAANATKSAARRATLQARQLGRVAEEAAEKAASAARLAGASMEEVEAISHAARLSARENGMQEIEHAFAKATGKELPVDPTTGRVTDGYTGLQKTLPQRLAAGEEVLRVDGPVGGQTLLAKMGYVPEEIRLDTPLKRALGIGANPAEWLMDKVREVSRPAREKIGLTGDALAARHQWLTENSEFYQKWMARGRKLINFISNPSTDTAAGISRMETEKFVGQKVRDYENKIADVFKKLDAAEVPEEHRHLAEAMSELLNPSTGEVYKQGRLAERHAKYADEIGALKLSSEQQAALYSASRELWQAKKAIREDMIAQGIPIPKLGEQVYRDLADRMAERKQFLKDHPEYKGPADQVITTKEGPEYPSLWPKKVDPTAFVGKDISQDDATAAKVSQWIGRPDVEPPKVKDLPKKELQQRKLDLQTAMRNHGNFSEDQINHVTAVYDALARTLHGDLGLPVDEFYSRTINKVIAKPDEVGPAVKSAGLQHSTFATVDFNLGDPRNVNGVITLFKGANVDSMLHEGAHIAYAALPDSERSLVHLWLQTTYGITDFAPGSESLAKGMELYSQAFERFCKYNEAPTKELRNIFVRIRDWMRDLKNALTEVAPSEIKMTPEMNSHFNKLLGGDGNTVFLPNGDGYKKLSIGTDYVDKQGKLKQWVQRARPEQLEEKLNTLYFYDGQIKPLREWYNYTYHTEKERTVFWPKGDPQYERANELAMEARKAGNVSANARPLPVGYERTTVKTEETAQDIERTLKRNIKDADPNIPADMPNDPYPAYPGLDEDAARAMASDPDFPSEEYARAQGAAPVTEPLPVTEPAKKSRKKKTATERVSEKVTAVKSEPPVITKEELAKLPKTPENVERVEKVLKDRLDSKQQDADKTAVSVRKSKEERHATVRERWQGAPEEVVNLYLKRSDLEDKIRELKAAGKGFNSERAQLESVNEKILKQKKLQKLEADVFAGVPLDRETKARPVDLLQGGKGKDEGVRVSSNTERSHGGKTFGGDMLKGVDRAAENETDTITRLRSMLANAEAEGNAELAAQVRATLAQYTKKTHDPEAILAGLKRELAETEPNTGRAMELTESIARTEKEVQTMAVLKRSAELDDLADEAEQMAFEFQATGNMALAKQYQQEAERIKAERALLPQVELEQSEDVSRHTLGQTSLYAETQVQRDPKVVYAELLEKAARIPRAQMSAADQAALSYALNRMQRYDALSKGQAKNVFIFGSPVDRQIAIQQIQVIHDLEKKYAAARQTAGQTVERNLERSALYHGRNNAHKLRDDVVIQWSHDFETAESYAGKNGKGSIWKLTDESSLVDASKAIALVKEKLKWFNDKGYGYPEWFKAYDADFDVLDGMNPRSIVDSAQLWDNTDFTQWFIETFDDIGGVSTHNGAVTWGHAGKPARITDPLAEARHTAGQTSLPGDLAGAQPRYAYRDKAYVLNFESDIDKALFIVAQPVKSKADEKYMEFLRGVFPGMSDSDIVARGNKLRNNVIKPRAKQGYDATADSLTEFEQVLASERSALAEAARKAQEAYETDQGAVVVSQLARERDDIAKRIAKREKQLQQAKDQYSGVLNIKASKHAESPAPAAPAAGTAQGPVLTGEQPAVQAPTMPGEVPADNPAALTAKQRADLDEKWAELNNEIARLQYVRDNELPSWSPAKIDPEITGKYTAEYEWPLDRADGTAGNSMNRQRRTFETGKLKGVPMTVEESGQQVLKGGSGTRATNYTDPTVAAGITETARVLFTRKGLEEAKANSKRAFFQQDPRKAYAAWLKGDVVKALTTSDAQKALASTFNAIPVRVWDDLTKAAGEGKHSLAELEQIFLAETGIELKAVRPELTDANFRDVLKGDSGPKGWIKKENWLTERAAARNRAGEKTTEAVLLHPAIAREYDNFMNVKMMEGRIMQLTGPFQTWLQNWKFVQTALWPKFHIRNQISDLSRMAQEDCLDAQTSRDFAVMTKRMFKYDPRSKGFSEFAGLTFDLGAEGAKKFGSQQVDGATFLKALADEYLIASGQVADALMRDADQVLKKNRTWTGMHLTEKYRNMLAFRDDMNRVAAVAARMRKGDDFIEATLRAEKALFNYKRISPAAQFLRRTGAAPFIAWSAKNIPAQIDWAVHNPGKFAAVMRVMDELANGQIPEEDVPDRLRDKYKVIVKTQKDADGNPEWVVAGMNGVLPWMDLKELYDAGGGRFAYDQLGSLVKFGWEYVSSANKSRGSSVDQARWENTDWVDKGLEAVGGLGYRGAQAALNSAKYWVTNDGIKVDKRGRPVKYLGEFLWDRTLPWNNTTIRSADLEKANKIAVAELKQAQEDLSRAEGALEQAGLFPNLDTSELKAEVARRKRNLSRQERETQQLLQNNMSMMEKAMGGEKAP